TLIDSYMGVAQGTMDRLLDWISRFTDIFDFSSSPPSNNAPMAEPDESEMEGGGGLEARVSVPDPFADFDGFEDQTWVGAIAALALCHGDTQRRRGQTRAALRRRVTVEPLACA